MCYKYEHTLKLLLCVFVIMTVRAQLIANITEETFENDTTFQCSQWDVIDISFRCKEKLADPFSVEFGATFKGPQLTKLKIPAFYNGAQIFTIRFSPPIVGTWTFETYSNSPLLAGKLGTVECLPQDNPKRHGPIVLKKDNPQHFYYADGTPYFLLAFEVDWLFALDCDNSKDIPKTKTLVNLIGESGFNQIIMNVYAYDVSWSKDPDLKPEHEFGAPTTFPFGGTNSNPDFSELNVNFFKHLDLVIQYLNRRGIIAHVMIYVWNKNVTWPEMYSKADNLYFDYIIARYQAFSNIIWDVSKEALGYGRCDLDYINERFQRIRKLDAYGRLLTVHDYNYCSKFPNKVDFISIQSWRSTLYHNMLAIREKHADKPVFNIEHGGYEEGPYQVFSGDYVDPEVCLQRNYQCIFAGTYSTYYWQCTSWNVIIPDPMNLPEADQPKFVYYRHLVEFFNRYDFSTLTPSESFSTSGYCLSNLNDLFLYFVPKHNYAIHITVPQGQYSTFRVTWFNPLTGEFLNQGKVNVRQWHEFKSPWKNTMAVLVMKGL